MKKLMKGFTMIELLIVIAVLGVLAVAVLSAINPIEQINRGRDTGSRSDAEQLISAIDRYYTSQGYYPWRTGPADAGVDATVWGVVDLTTWKDNATVPLAILTKLSSGGTSEVKLSFVDRITKTTYNTLYKINEGEPGNSTYVCFKAASASFKTEALKRCGATDAEIAAKTYVCSALPADLVGAADVLPCTTICNVTTPYICLP